MPDISRNRPQTEEQPCAVGSANAKGGYNPVLTRNNQQISKAQQQQDINKFIHDSDAQTKQREESRHDDEQGSCLAERPRGPRDISLPPTAGLVDVVEVEGEVKGKDGKPRMIKRYKPVVRTHELRHTFASHLASNGASLRSSASSLATHRQRHEAVFTPTGREPAHLNEPVREDYRVPAQMSLSISLKLECTLRSSQRDTNNSQRLDRRMVVRPRSRAALAAGQLIR